MAYRCIQGRDWCTGCNGGRPCDELDLNIIGCCETCGDVIFEGEEHFDFEGEYVHDAYDCLRTYWDACYKPG